MVHLRAPADLTGTGYQFSLDDVDLPPGLSLCTNYSARAGLPGRFRDAKRVADATRGAGGGGSADESAAEATTAP